MLRSYLEGLLMAREGVEGGCKENYEQHSTGMFIQSWRGVLEHHMDPLTTQQNTQEGCETDQKCHACKSPS